MRFEIDRASDHFGKASPCDGAQLREVDKYGDATWEIEISDLDALIELIKRQGQLVVSRDSITIYDTYIE